MCPPIDLTEQTLNDAPNDIQFHINRSESFLASFSNENRIIDLSDFEDLYYAACAKIKEFLHRADILVANGFKRPRDDFIRFPYVPLASIGPIKLGDFESCLLAQQSLLQSKQLTQLLDKAIKNRSLLHSPGPIARDKIDSSITRQSGHIGQIEKGISTTTYESAQTATIRCRMEGIESSSSANTLLGVSKMSSGMIFAQLAEKYRFSSGNVGSCVKPTAGPGSNPTPECAEIKKYVSPYNLEERAKKLDEPGRPEMPCICDPECICVPLCASDPDQNCLCEENGLFVRVTEGMDIDDLDVPDLVRRKRESSESTDYSVRSAAGHARLRGDNKTLWERNIDPSFDERVALEEIANQGYQQEAQATSEFDSSKPLQSTSTELDGILCSSNLVQSSEGYAASLYHIEAFGSHSRRLEFDCREALVRPFAKQCATPPRGQDPRASVTKRFFSGAFDSIPPETAFIDSLQGVLKGATTKQGNKRTLTDVSLPTLKRTFRR